MLAAPAVVGSAFASPDRPDRVGDPTEGELRIIGPDGVVAGFCPLKHTDVSADVAGFFGHVSVRQEFHNPTRDKIEAVYVFPLPQDAAVGAMTMTVGDRVIRGLIKEREEAQRIYDAAKQAGHVAGMLSQERPNIFTQAVANIEPGARVLIEIRYVEMLKLQDGWYEFVFPMVVGPRYIPGQPISQPGLGWSPDTDRTPDASRITPPVAARGERAGHDISVTVRLDAGRPLADLTSTLHEVSVERPGEREARVTLKERAAIPNKDFILRYRTATDDIGDAVLAHAGGPYLFGQCKVGEDVGGGGFFTLVLEPPKRVRPSAAVPRELVFVLDTSGSMSGHPIEKAKDVMARAIGAMRPGDRFNVITFSGDTHVLWERPLPATPRNIAAARQFVETRAGGGGTEMMKAIHAALVQESLAADEAAPMRIAMFMTDGYVGNDLEIIDAVRKNAATTRVFSFGIGNSVNRFLLDGMAAAGRGEVEYVTLADDASAAAARFAERISTPVLADISIDFGDAPVADVQPATIPDLFSVKPLVVHGRYLRGFDGAITLRGRTGAGAFQRSIRLKLPSSDSEHPALPTLWARARVAELMSNDLLGMQRGQPDASIRQSILALGLRFSLLTPYTSFVAVEEQRVTEGGQSRTVMVPVDMPDGVSHEGVFGDRGDQNMKLRQLTTAAVGAPAEALQSSHVRRGGGSGLRPPRTEAADKLSRLGYLAEGDGSNQGRGGVIGGGRKKGDESREYSAATQPRDPGATKEAVDKLAPALRELADRIARHGAVDEYRDGDLHIRGGRIEVMVTLRQATAEVLAALQALGAELADKPAAATNGDVAASVRVRIRIRADKLADLCAIEAVLRVEPMPKIPAPAEAAKSP